MNKVTPISKARFTKRFLTRYLSRQRSESSSQGSDTLPADLNTSATDLHEIESIFGHVKVAGTPGMKPGWIVDPALPIDDFAELFSRFVRPMPGTLLEDTGMMIDLIRVSLSESSQLSATVFTACTLPISREEVSGSRRVLDDGRGAVVVFYRDENVVCVRATDTFVKSRLKERVSPLVETSWWSEWTHIRILPLNSIENRTLMENLLAMALVTPVEQRPSTVNSISSTETEVW